MRQLGLRRGDLGGQRVERPAPAQRRDGAGPLVGVETAHADRRPQRHGVLAVLTPDEPADAVSAHAQLDRELAPEPQRVEPRAHPEHAVPPEPLRHDRHAELHGVRHDDDHLVPGAVPRDRVRVLGEDGAVRRGQDPAVGVGARARRGREARSHHDHVGRDLLGGVRDVEERRVLVVRVDQVGAQPVHGAARRPADPTDELEPRRRREHPPLDDLRAHLPADVPRRPHHRYVHPGRLRPDR